MMQIALAHHTTCTLIMCWTLIAKIRSVSTDTNTGKHVMLKQRYSTCYTVQVETIGDAYMVVSGLPERNGNAHSGEIGDMSLEILRRLENFKLKAIPEQRVMVRIGLHTGPVCAGVMFNKLSLLPVFLSRSFEVDSSPIIDF